MKEILVFAHNYVGNNWYEIVDEQLTKLVDSGLYYQATKIYYGAYSSNQEQLTKFIKLVKSKDVRRKIQIIIHPNNDGEKQTLIFLQETVKNYEDAYVLYYHTKGVTTLQQHTDKPDLDYKNTESWRHIMEYYAIERWQYSVNEFIRHPHVDTVGCLYIGDDGYPNKYFYAGNFWWATSAHINQLPDMKLRDNRMGCELWICAKPHNWLNLFPAHGGEIYYEYYDPKDYRKDLDTRN
jgi:hypothetical protein